MIETKPGVIKKQPTGKVLEVIVPLVFFDYAKKIGGEVIILHSHDQTVKRVASPNVADAFKRFKSCIGGIWHGDDINEIIANGLNKLAAEIEQANKREDTK